MKPLPTKFLIGSMIALLMQSATGCATSKSKTETILDAAQIKALYTGKTIQATHVPKQVPVKLYYDSNGEVRGLFASGKHGKTSWHVKEDGHICLLVGGEDTCFSVVQKGNHYQKFIMKPDGKKILVFDVESFTEGNPNLY